MQFLILIKNHQHEFFEIRKFVDQNDNLNSKNDKIVDWNEFKIVHEIIDIVYVNFFFIVRLNFDDFKIKKMIRSNIDRHVCANRK